jgi:molecular chaperone DnaK
MYEASQAEQAASTETGEKAAAGNEDVVDADFEEIDEDDDKKKSA